VRYIRVFSVLAALSLLLGLLSASASVATAMGASHMVSEHKGGTLLQVVCYGGMVAAMVQSIGAIAAVIGPVDGRAFKWVFGIAMDVLSLAALRVVMVENQRHAALEAAKRAEREAIARADGMPLSGLDESREHPLDRAIRESQGGPVGGTAVYTFFDREDMPMYIGVTNDFGIRWRDHAASKPWWPEVFRMGVTWFDNREAALTYEAEGIRLIPHRYNVQNNPVAPAKVRARPQVTVKDPDSEKARADYRRSVREGAPLSDRALGAKYGRSRTWGASRIKEAEGGPKLAPALAESAVSG
jgi:hypothetical protein